MGYLMSKPSCLKNIIIIIILLFMNFLHQL